MNVTSLNSNTAPAPFGGSRLLKASEVQHLLGYTNKGAFFAAVRAAGVPFIKFNQRRILFEEAAVQAWLDSRTVGGLSR